LVFKKTGGTVTEFCDADWAGGRDDYPGYVFTLANAPISWKAQKQSQPALSSMESEFYAATLAVQEALWLLRFITKLSLPQR
jgi:hypothetical protein